MTPKQGLLNRCRVRRGPMASVDSFGPCGAFFVPGPKGILTVIATDGTDLPAPDGTVWEHVSVSTPKRTPTWGEMVFVRGLFWGDDEVVMQLHPPRERYVNNHAYCLHLWRPVGVEIPLPPDVFVGHRDLGTVHE